MKTIILSVAATLLVLAGAGGAGAYYAYQNRAALFDYFASQYIESAQEGDESGGQNILTEESLIVDVIESANPSVISIVATKDVPVIEQYYEEYSPFGGGYSFRIPQYRQNGTEEREVGGGTGFIVSASGLAVTNKHVVSDEEATYTAFTNDGEKYEVEIIAQDPFYDIAILQLQDGNDFPALQFTDSESLKLGQTVIAIGNALGEFRNSVSVGIVSGLSRSVTASGPEGQSEQLEEVIQTDAAINPGNSGGPLLNLHGNVVGVNVAVALGSENIGFALPANVVRSVVESVEKHGEIVRPYLGVRYTAVTEKLAEQNNLSVEYGALVVRGASAEQLAVIPGSPADKAGIVENDIILEIDGERIDEGNSLASAIRDRSVGDTVTLKILHDGEEKTVEATLEKAPERLN